MQTGNSGSAKKQQKLSFKRKQPNDAEDESSGGPSKRVKTVKALCFSEQTDPSGAGESKSKVSAINIPPDSTGSKTRLPLELRIIGKNVSPVSPAQQAPPKSQKLEIEYREGDIFDAAKGTILLHSCNCRGAWGKGIAAEFRKRYQSAYWTHKALCDANVPRRILGSSLLIPPPPTEDGRSDDKGHYVACLFTRENWGMKPPPVPQQIVESTSESMKSLLEGIRLARESGELKDLIELRMPLINAGLFRVPWEQTEEVLKDLDVASDDNSVKKVVVYLRPSK